MANRKVILEKLKVNKDGDRLDKGELYWSFTANSKAMTERPRNNVLKVKNGQIVSLGNEDLIVNGLRGTDTLTVEGFVAEKDGAFSSDERGDFRHIHSEGDKWGLGSHTASIKDGALDVILYYRIEAV